MREKCCSGLLAIMLLVAGGCGMEKIPEPPPLDEVKASAGAAKVERTTAGSSAPEGVGVATVERMPDAVRPDAGSKGGKVANKTGNASKYGAAGANVSAGAAKVERTTAGSSVPEDVGFATVERMPDAVRPDAGSKSGKAANQEGNVGKYGVEGGPQDDATGYGRGGTMQTM